MHVTEESHCGIVPMNHSNKDGTLVGGEWGGKAADQGEHFSIWHVPDSERDVYVSHGWASVRTSCSLGRYSSEIRTGCANERPSGSVRGAPGNWCPYRDQHSIVESAVVRTQKPALRITRWLRSRRQPIPLEAECTACAEAQFKIKYDKRSGPFFFDRRTPLGPPDHDRCRSALQSEFEEHVNLVHPDERVIRNNPQSRK